MDERALVGWVEPIRAFTPACAGLRNPSRTSRTAPIAIFHPRVARDVMGFAIAGVNARNSLYPSYENNAGYWFSSGMVL
jgi:hypothetical protein